MVKLYALTILHKGPISATPLKSAYAVESFSYFQRNSVREFMAFVSKTITERTQIAARQSVKEGGNIEILNGQKPFVITVVIYFSVFLRIHIY